MAIDESDYMGAIFYDINDFLTVPQIVGIIFWPKGHMRKKNNLLVQENLKQIIHKSYESGGDLSRRGL